MTNVTLCHVLMYTKTEIYIYKLIIKQKTSRHQQDLNFHIQLRVYDTSNEI